MPKDFIKRQIKNYHKNSIKKYNENNPNFLFEMQ